MVAPNEKPEPTLTSKDLHAVLCICVKLLGGVAIPEAVLKAMPEGTKLKAVFSEVDKKWYFSVPVKRKRGIIKPRRKPIILEP